MFPFLYIFKSHSYTLSQTTQCPGRLPEFPTIFWIFCRKRLLLGFGRFFVGHGGGFAICCSRQPGSSLLKYQVGIRLGNEGKVQKLFCMINSSKIARKGKKNALRQKAIFGNLLLDFVFQIRPSCRVTRVIRPICDKCVMVVWTTNITESAF